MGGGVINHQPRLYGSFPFVYIIGNYIGGCISEEIYKKFRPDFAIFFAFGGIFRCQNISIWIESFDFVVSTPPNDPVLAIAWPILF